MISKELHSRVIEKLEEVITIAEEHFEQKFAFPTIVYKKRGRTAGTANTRGWTLDFNRALFEQNVEDFLARTVAHEMAHLIDSQINPEGHEHRVVRGRNGYRRTKRDIHGRHWKNVMRVIGADSSRCHSYDVSTVSRKSERFVWICSVHGTEMSLGPKQHRNQMKTPGGMYTPRKTRCGSICTSKFQYNTLIAPVVPVAIAADAPKTPTQQSGESNRSIAAKLFFLDNDRGSFIRRCEGEGIKKTTASTYHHNFKSGKWS